MSNQSENPDVPYIDASSLLRVSTWMSDFERELFSAALRNLHDASNPLRLNNFAFSVRELMRHVLHRLAPDENVLRCPWYANETPTPQGISRRQRALYAIQGGLQDSYVTGILGINSIAQQKAMSRAIEVLNKYTHVGPTTFASNADDIKSVTTATINAIIGLLSTIDECRKNIVRGLEDKLHEAAIDQVLSDSLIGLIDLASHFSVEDVDIATITVSSIDDQSVHYEAVGLIHCILQFGSNSDLRRGDGAEVPQSFPCRCALSSPVEDPTEIEIDEDSVGVDTSEWERLRYGADEYDG